MSTGPAAECAPRGFPEALSWSPMCSVCTSLSSPLAMDTEPAALTEPSTGLPIAAAPGRLPPGLTTPAALVGRGPAGSPALVEQGSGDPPELVTDRPLLPTAICQPPCGNGGSCIRPGHCRCPVGWQGDTCHIDVDECSTGEAVCPQRCVNTVGSYWCQCREGQSPSADGRHCLPKEGPPLVAPNPSTGVDSVVREQVHRLQSRVDVLEQKLQLVLAPLHSLASRAPEPGLQDPGSLLAHSFQQLDRIDSLSEQVSFLEEQLGSCECHTSPPTEIPGNLWGGRNCHWGRADLQA
ncbi:epidermal growth factor-like protein 7 isoform X2 [Peromyscus maniculatus bairdii]|uniref:epidermal growth factor-like protein 7 isoform X2 n=1 Tax=Peromyscus maniculatus bairdii TaxID=230844 RepID=UPI003FCF719D